MIPVIYFILLIVSYSFGPRLFSGVRLDDVLLPGVVLILAIYAQRISNYRPASSIVVYLVFVGYSFFLGIYAFAKWSHPAMDSVIFAGKYATYFMAVLAAYLAAVSKPRLGGKVILRVIYFCILANIFWFIFQMFFGYQVAWGESEASSYGLKAIGEGAAFQVGSMISYIACFFLCMIFQSSNGRKTVLFLGYIFLIYCLYLTQSRINLFAVLLASIYIVHHYVPRGIYYLVPVLAVLAVMLGWFYIYPAITAEANSRFTVDAVTASFYVRVDEIWGRALSGIAESFLFGNGLGAFSIDSQTNEVHNYYLKILYEGGVVYFLIFISFVVSVFKWPSIKMAKLLQMEAAWVLIRSFMIVLLVCAFFQDAFSSSKAVIPVLMLIGYFSGLIAVRTKAL